MTTLSDWLRRCRANPAPMTEWETDFLRDLERRGREPTPAQLVTLDRIAGRAAVADLAEQLAERIADVAESLIGNPPSARDSNEFRYGRHQSLSVMVAGPKRGAFYDHEAGAGGGALSLIQHVRRCSFADAVDWARAWLGQCGSLPPPAAPRPAAPAEPDAEALAKRRAALAMFLAAEPNLAGTPAAAYLAARGIDLADLRRQPRALRFAPALFNTESGDRWPAMLAAIVRGGEHVATHRTWLAKDDAGVWRKAPLKAARKVLGPMGGGAVPLWRGASGKPLAAAPDGETVVIGEGIETCLSVALALPEFRVLAALSVGNLAAIALPPTVRSVILLAENDGADAAAARAFRRAVERFAAEGRAVKIAVPPLGKDFNDTLREAQP